MKLLKKNMYVINKFLLVVTGLMSTVVVYRNVSSGRLITLSLSFISLLFFCKTKLPNDILDVIKSFSKEKFIIIAIITATTVNFQIIVFANSLFFQRFIDVISGIIIIPLIMYLLAFLVASFYFFFHFFTWVYFIFAKEIILPIINGLVHKVKEYNINIYILLSGVFIIILLINTFTVIFYDTPRYNVIFQTDTNAIVERFMNISDGGNAIRQPLFGLVMSPLVAPIYFLANLFPQMFNFYPALMMLLQFCLIILSAYMIYDLTKEKLKYPKLLFFYYLSSYSTIIFSLVLERFIFSTFFLVLFIYITQKGIIKQQIPGFIMAIGSLSTSAAMGILLLDFKKKSNFKKTVFNAIYATIIFLAIMSVFGQLVQLLLLEQNFGHIDKFTAGYELSILDRLYYYTNFIYGLFLMPTTFIRDGYHYEQLHTTLESTIGWLILIGCLVSGIIHYKDKFAKISLYWMFISFMVLVVWGLGMVQTDGILLFSVTFSFAYIYMFYRLLETMLCRFQHSRIILIIILFTVSLINIYGLIDVIRFGIYQYPGRLLSVL